MSIQHENKYTPAVHGKYYFMDTGLLGLMLLDCKSAQLENLVAIELMRRYGTENVYFFENSVEIDFYVPLDNLAI